MGKESREVRDALCKGTDAGLYRLIVYLDRIAQPPRSKRRQNRKHNERFRLRGANFWVTGSHAKAYNRSREKGTYRSTYAKEMQSPRQQSIQTRLNRRCLPVDWRNSGSRPIYFFHLPDALRWKSHLGQVKPSSWHGQSEQRWEASPATRAAAVAAQRPANVWSPRSRKSQIDRKLLFWLGQPRSSATMVQGKRLACIRGGVAILDERRFLAMDSGLDRSNNAPQCTLRS